jgi:hypothetical protein
LCIESAFTEGLKISRIQHSHSSHVAWKEDDQQYPPVYGHLRQACTILPRFTTPRPHRRDAKHQPIAFKQRINRNHSKNFFTSRMHFFHRLPFLPLPLTVVVSVSFFIFASRPQGASTRRTKLTNHYRTPWYSCSVAWRLQEATPIQGENRSLCPGVFYCPVGFDGEKHLPCL